MGMMRLYFRKGLPRSIEGRHLVSTVKKTPALFEETLNSDVSESRERTMVNRSLSFVCAEHVDLLGGESPLSNLMEVKDK